MKTLKSIIFSDYFILFIISLILFLFLINIPLNETHDGWLHILRILGTDMTIKEGVFPPIINPEFCRGFGYAINLFYGSLVTYLPLLIKLFISSYAVALKAFTFITIFLSAIFMHKFIFQVTNKKAPALFGSIIYILAPYKLTNIYVRFAIGEFTAFVFIPLVFLGLYSLLNQDGKKHYYIAIGAIGLILSHTISAFYTAIFCFIYILFNIKKLKQIDIIKKIIINLVFILLVSAFFTVPLLEHKLETEYTIFNSEIMNTTGRDVSISAIEPIQLFIGYTDTSLTFKLGIPIILSLLLGIIAYKKIDKKYLNFYLIFILFAVISIYMSTRYFPWAIMPNILSLLQFSWRMLGFAVFFISFICGIHINILFEMIKKDKEKIILMLCLVIIMILCAIPTLVHFNNLYVSEEKTVTSDEQLEKNILNIRKINHFSINREYLPLKAYKLINSYMQQRDLSVIVLKGNANIENDIKELSTLTFNVKDVTNNTILELPYLYYLGYEVTLTNRDNEEIKIDTFESENGFLAIKLDNIEEAFVKVEYKGTTLTKISYIISAISLIIFCVYIYRSKNEKNIKK